MRKFIRWGIAVAAVLADAIGGYRLGAGQWPSWHSILHHSADQRSEPAAPAQASPAERTILYWKHPDGNADFSPALKKTADGRDYVPVFEEQEENFEDAKAQQAAKAKNAGGKASRTAEPKPKGPKS